MQLHTRLGSRLPLHTEHALCITRPRPCRQHGPHTAWCSQQQQQCHAQQRQRRRLSAPLRAFQGDPAFEGAFDRGDPSKALKEAAALDELIDMLLSAKSQQELAKLVAENIFSFDSKFWMRIATRNDSTASAADKDKLANLANTVMVLVDAMVKQTEAQLQDSSRILQDILKAAADDKGEWYLPLTEDQVRSVREALDKHSAHLDEALLSNAFAWIKKCNDDSFDSMAALIQKVLQLYAARQLQGPEKQGVDGALNRIIWAEEADWSGLITAQARAGEFNEAAFMESLQKKMEATVLGMQSGSYAQRVQVLYLKELETRAKGVFRELAAAGSAGSQSSSSEGSSGSSP